MKLLVLSTFFAVAFGVQLGLNSQEWTQFKAKHGKKYSDSAKEAQRLAIYMQNKNHVDQHNAAGKATFQLGINEYADLSTEEIATRMNGFKGAPATVSVSATAPTVGAAPTSIDWRTLGYVTPVKNQGQCGSCWSFSATGALEGQNFRKTGKLVSLSEQNLVDCSSNSTYGNAGCNGGWMNSAFKYVKANGGIDTAASYPYTAVKGATCNFVRANVGGTCTGYVTIAQTEAALMAAVGTVGPVSVAIDASQRTFQLYKSGVYYEPLCNSTRLNHGVLVVGYGTANGSDYWLVKNSWGTTWGEQGYIRMARNKNNNCAIATAASYPTV